MHKSKKFFALLFLMMIGIAAAAPFALAETLAEQQKVIRVAGDNNFPPFEYLGESGVYTGFNVDIMNAVSIETGVKIEYHPMPWNKALEALSSGEVDAIEGMKYSKGRDQIYDFSDPYLMSSEAIFVLNENLYIFDLNDLEGRKIAVQEGDIANDLVSSLQRAKFYTTESQEEAIQLLMDGKVDAFVGNRITGQYFLQEHNEQAKVKIVGKPLDPTDYCIAVLPKNKELLTIFNDGISKIKSNGTYEKIQQKWFPNYDIPSSVKLERVLFYLKMGSLITAFIFIAVLWWNRLLKREVSRRINQISVINTELEDKMVQLEANFQFQKQLVDSTYYFLVTLDREGRIININRKAMEYFKIGEDIIGETIESTILTTLVTPDEIRDVLESGSVFLHKEKILDWDSQDKRAISYSVYPIVLASQEITGVIINLQDITEQKQMEKEIEREDRLRSLGQLVLGIAHEIRNPLMSILTYTQLLPKKMENEQFREFFAQHVPSEIKRLNELVNELLDFARPKKSAPIKFSMEQLLTSVVQLFKQKLQEKKAEVSLDIKEGLEAFADMQQIKQVFINIILNGIEAVDEHGKIAIRGFHNGNYVVVEVADNGCGVPEQEMDKLFEPFYSTKVNGVGLGLSITYQLIKANHGYIDVKKNPGGGIRMLIQLPRHEEGEHMA